MFEPAGRALDNWVQVKEVEERSDIGEPVMSDRVNQRNIEPSIIHLIYILEKRQNKPRS